MEIRRGVPSLTLGLLLAALPAAAQQGTPGVARRTGAKSTVRESALATIRVTAVNSINGPLRNSLVRVRDARLGRIVDRAVTDQAGASLFRSLDPGNYIVELVSTDQTPLAATSLISVNAGDTVSAVLKLPFKPTMVGSLPGNRASPSNGTAGGSVSEIVPQLLEQLPQAAAQAIPAVVPTGTPISER